MQYSVVETAEETARDMKRLHTHKNVLLKNLPKKSLKKSQGIIFANFLLFS